MLDVAVLVKAVLVGALTAAAVMRLAAWSAVRPWCGEACWSWAVGAGVLAASAATGEWPHWPPLEDRARFLTLLVPLTMLVEMLTAVTRSGRMRWLARLALAAVAAPIVLHQSVYLAVLPGRDAAEWTPVQAMLILGGLAALLVLVWAALSALQARTSTQTVQWVLALDALATAVTVMLSGYYLAGRLGWGLAGAIGGATLSSHLGRRSPVPGSVGMSVVGIFAVVLMGRFFGTLSTGLASCLLLAPLAAWTMELPWLRTRAPGWRLAGRLACVAALLTITVTIAERRFIAASNARSNPAESNVMQDSAK